MCRWGCTTTSTTYMCKWCGTRYCRECLRGDFTGVMEEETKCRICNQKRCQGKRVEYVERPATAKEDGKKSRPGTSKSARSRSASPRKGAKSAKRSKSAKPKSGKKKKKKK